MKNDDNFDCMKMKRKGAATVQNKLKNLSDKEELSYWKKKYDDLIHIQHTIKEAPEKYSIKNIPNHMISEKESEYNSQQGEKSIEK
jgi:hypothetical protein